MKDFLKISLISLIICCCLIVAQEIPKRNSTTKKMQISGGKRPPSGMNASRNKTTIKPSTVDKKFNEFKKKYNKSYASKNEETAAKKAFEQNLKNDINHNENENKIYQRGTNSYSDKNYSWKVSNRMGARKSKASKTASRLPVKSSSLLTRMNENEDAIPESANWTDWNTPVRDQADCGACWVFASLAVLEYLTVVIRENPVDLSEQEILDCYGFDNGCDGGWPTDSFDFVIKNGVTSEKSYPYLAYQSDCLGKRFARSLIINETFEEELYGDEELLKAIVYYYGPTIVVIYASDSFTQYAGGVFSEPNCPNDPESYNHAIVIVGYGSSPKEGDFWIFKNSWGTTWGEQGYGRIARNKDNMCGVANYAMNPSSSWIAETDIDIKKGRK